MEQKKLMIGNIEACDRGKNMLLRKYFSSVVESGNEITGHGSLCLIYLEYKKQLMIFQSLRYMALQILSDEQKISGDRYKGYKK